MLGAGALRRAAVDGDAKNGSLLCGQIAGLVNRGAAPPKSSRKYSRRRKSCCAEQNSRTEFLSVNVCAANNESCGVIARSPITRIAEMRESARPKERCANHLPAGASPPEADVQSTLRFIKFDPRGLPRPRLTFSLRFASSSLPAGLPRPRLTFGLRFASSSLPAGASPPEADVRSTLRFIKSLPAGDSPPEADVRSTLRFIKFARGASPPSCYGKNIICVFRSGRAVRRNG